MKKILIIALLINTAAAVFAQTTKIMGFPITDYITNAGDSVTIVQVKLPQGLAIPEKKLGLLKTIYKSPLDTATTIATGRCQLVKGDYYYFGLQTKNIIKKPKGGELLYTTVTIPASFYTGIIFNITTHHITLNSVEGTLLADISIAIKITNAADETAIIEKIVADVKFTGKAMSQQGDSQDALITTGKFRDKKVFAAMQAITAADIKDFLEYIAARPTMYAGNTWSVSEITATWMAAGAPTVVK